MTKFLISFPGSAMQLSPEEFEAAGRESRAVLLEMRAAAVYVFGGGINEDIPSTMVSANGHTSNETYPQTREFNGGFTVIECETRAEAVHWAAKVAAACRCPQELREFMYDPAS